MTFTLSLKALGIILLIVALIVMVIYIIRLFKNLIVTVKKTNEILSDVTTMTDIAEKRTKEVDKVVENVIDAATTVTTALKGQESIVKQLSAIGAAISSIIGILKGKKENKEEKSKDVK